MKARTAIILVVGLTVLGLAILNHRRRTVPRPPTEQTEPVSTKRVFRPRLPAPRLPAKPALAEAPAENPPLANAYARLLKNEGEPPKLSRDQIESYLAQNRRGAECLLAAFRLTGDPSLLKEAAEKQPNDPRVNFAGWVAASREGGGSPEERRQWLDAFKRSAPDNALANYLAAQDFFKSGQPDQGVRELMAASGKSRFQDYSADCLQNLEEAYLSAGYPAAEAKASTTYSVLLPHLRHLKELGQNLGDLATLYRQGGDETSAQAALQIGVDAGQRLEQSAGGSLLIHNLVGLAIERRLLGALDPNLPYGDTGQTVQNQVDALAQRVEALKGLSRQAEPVLQNMSDQDLIRYFDRVKIFGEAEALRWAVNR